MTEHGISGRRGGISIRSVLVLAILALAVPAMTLTTPRTASAVGNHLCETNGSFCVGSADLNVDTAVSERNPGRDLELVDQGTTFEGHEIYKIRFQADTTKCVAGANDHFRVVIHLCDHDGVDWALNPNSNGHLRFINKEATIAEGVDLYLCGSNNGGDYMLEPLGFGFFCNFDLV